MVLLLVVVIPFSLALFAYNFYKARPQKQGCQPARRYKHKDPIFGLDIFIKTIYALTKNQFLDEHQRRYDTYGHTFEAVNFRSLVIYSVHPDNLGAVWSKKAADWGIEPLRLTNMDPFCGGGFATADGKKWKDSQALLKPGFRKSNISNFTPLEEHLRIMLEQIPKDRSKFDLQPWIFKMYLDLNTLFLFGEPIGMLSGSPPPHAEGFLDAFQEGFNGCGMRIALGPLRIMMPKGSWLKACQKTHNFADVYVDRALEYRKRHDLAQNRAAPAKDRILLYNMAQQIDSKTVLRNQIVQAMMVATETTATLISNIIYNLAANPLVFAKLRAEVLAVGNEPLDFDRLARIKYLQNVITETLRLYPVAAQNNRVALRDTILPTGGGPDGTAPVFAPAGTLFDTCFATLHRDKQIWGDNADKFCPCRWDNSFSPAPFTFMPFGAGPRQCLGQQKATMEASYIIARFVQEFEDIRSEDDRPWQAQVALTAKNANGCLVSLRRAGNHE